mmetsp:Transcript_1295/g.2453  ORF Transcript_1295/g.2453 Transcript_1295/m.2453 type:complete len:212 (-) Transcript_1295:1021-1656(-)
MPMHTVERNLGRCCKSTKSRPQPQGMAFLSRFHLISCLPPRLGQLGNLLAICAPRQLRAFLSTLGGCWSTTVAGCPLLLLKLVLLFAMRLAHGLGYCESGSSKWQRSNTLWTQTTKTIQSSKTWRATRCRCCPQLIKLVKTCVGRGRAVMQWQRVLSTTRRLLISWLALTNSLSRSVSTPRGCGSASTRAMKWLTTPPIAGTLRSIALTGG